jgi:hypothetical protein
MKLQRLHRDTQGAMLVEFAITYPVFLIVIFCIIEVGLLMWTQLGLQHGAEMAARCVSIGSYCIVNGNNLLCSTGSGASLVANVSNTQQCAAQWSWGLKPAASTFTVKTNAANGTTCGSVPGNLVTANYNFTYWLSGPNFQNATWNIVRQSCYPNP